MIPYARLMPGPGFHFGQSTRYYAQRLVTDPGLRFRISRVIAATIPRPVEAQQDADPATVDTLKATGISMLSGLVAKDAADALRTYFLPRPVCLPDGGLVGLNEVPPGTATACYPLATILENSTVLDLIHAPRVLGAVAAYLGCSPTVSSLGVRWSFPHGRTVDAVQRFHRDPDDWRFLKLFLYLTDVDEGSGPHLYAEGSHLTAGRWRARPYDPHELTGVRQILGPSGTAFLADTYGIHAGAIPTERPRLILQVQYSLLPIYCFRYDPISLAASTKIDGRMMRLLIARRPAAGGPPG